MNDKGIVVELYSKHWLGFSNGNPSYFADVVSIQKTGEHFRILYDVKGRFIAHRITDEEAKVR